MQFYGLHFFSLLYCGGLSSTITPSTTRRVGLGSHEGCPPMMIAPSGVRPAPQTGQCAAPLEYSVHA